MAEDVILHGGDLTEFLRTQRCEDCQVRDGDCIIKREADACLACSITKKSCIFERRARLRGSAKSLTHGLLLSQEEVINVKDGFLYKPKEPTFTLLGSFSEHSASVHPEAQALSETGQANRTNSRNKFYPIWMRALTICTASSAFREAGRKYATSTRNNASSTKPVHPPKPENHASSIRQRKLEMRKLRRACPTCRAKKVKCRHYDELNCPLCDNHPLGFRGEHELQRHIDRVHPPRRTAYICVDLSSDGKFLANCEACRNEETYKGPYYAAAHLRRAHFRDNRDKLSLEELTPWVKEIEIDVSREYAIVMDDDASSVEAMEEDDDAPTTPIPIRWAEKTS